MDKGHEKTEDKLKEMEEHLRKIYERADRETGKKLKEYLIEQNKRIVRLQKDYEEALSSGDRKEIQKTKYELERVKRNKTLNSRRFQERRMQYAEELLHVNETALAYINGKLPEVYSINYNQLGEDVEGLGGYSFTLVDPDTIKKLAADNETLLPYKEVDGRRDVRWNTKVVNSEVMQGILQGESMAAIAERLSRVAGMNARTAITNARTSVTSAENKGRLDSYHRAEKDGIILKKEWLSSDNSRTRNWHFSSDFEKLIVPIDEPFHNSMGEIRYPGDPAAKPANVYNCRCSMKAVIEGFDKSKVAAAMQEQEKQKKAAAKPKTKTRAKKAIKTTKFVPATTLEEAENFIKQYVNKDQFGATGVSYKGIDVEVANVLNEVISDFYDNFKADPFGGIIAPAGNTKLGKLISNATAAYNTITKSFLLNRKSMKTLKIANKNFLEEKRAYEELTTHPEKYDFNKLSRKMVETLERSKESGRATVPDTIAEAITHELGHSIEGAVFKNELWKKAEENMPKFANKISGYAGENRSEYVAESFASYLKGEKVIDPVMRKIFEELRK